MSARVSKPDGLDFSYMRPTSSTSLSSDVISNSARSASTMHHVPHANPPPAYIAQGEASDLLSAELERNVNVSPPALALLNEFLDNVLYSIISTSHSVALGQLKASVPAVLKPRLGKAALRVAEEELKEYMEDEEAEELYSNKHSLQPKLDFDADLVWKLARLRCMVYARMGDLEEEDEEEWLEKEHLLEQAAASSVSSRQSMAINPAAAIFLTSVVEYLGEQALYYAAQHAQKRHDSARVQQGATVEDQLAVRDAEIVLDGKDMNHVGRDSPLSRLWRSWRRNTRSPGDASSRPMSPENLFSLRPDSLHSRTTSSSTHHSIQPILEEYRAPLAGSRAIESPSQIPLPISDNDIEEIEGYGVLATNTIAPAHGISRRPLSMPAMPGNFPEEPSTPSHDLPEFQERSPLRGEFKRQRSNSVPTLRTSFGTATGEVHAISSQEEGSEEDEEMDLPIQGGTTAEPTHQLESADEAMGGVDASKIDVRPSADSEVKQGAPAASSDQLNNTVGAIASALTVGGIYHIQQRNLQPIIVNPAQSLASRDARGSEQPLTSASITGPCDFDVMHLPEARFSPEEQETILSKSAASGKDPSVQRASYHDRITQSHEDDVSYSRDIEGMGTPPIYPTQEHSPRFPKDMRSVSRRSEPRDRIESSYAPTSEPDTPYHGAPNHYHALAPVAEARGDHVQEADSPVSVTGSKFSNNRFPPITETIPELPGDKSTQQVLAESAFASHSRGHSKSSSSSSRLLGFTRDPMGRPQTIYQQRAAGDMTDDVRHAHSSTPNSANRNEGSVTANASKPQTQQHTRIRTDSEDNVYRSADEDFAQRSLEKLIQSDETLHYTLTPATATFRQDDLNSSPKRTETQDLAEFFRATAPPGQEHTRPGTARSHRASMEAAQAQQLPSTPERKSVPSSKDTVLEKSPGPKHKNPMGEPRDAKVERVTGMRDLADYVRSTGPSTDDQLPKPLASKARPVTPDKPRSVVPKAPVPTSGSIASKRANRLKLQARDARPSRNAESTALIDFIREGPPREAGDHRINRNIAPFRTTMDSDDLNALASSTPKDSTDTNGIRSIDTTTNSQSPLLSNESRIANTPKPLATMQQGPATDANDGMPKKTQRRVKDPYAIDDDDDIEVFEERPKQTNDESLIDFLRNTAPSQNMATQVKLSYPEPASSNLSRTPSVDRLKDFVRSGKGNTNGQVSGARAESPHLTQTGSKLDSYRPTQATHAAHIERNRQKLRDEARSSVKGYGATADLAHYLKNTGPPPSSQQQPQPFILNGKQTNEVVKQEGGLKKFFSMRGRNN